VLRHAGPRAAAHVCLRYQPDRLIITVTDDGGGEVAYGGGITHGNGISGMRERAVSVGGELTAGPLPGGGFRVQATLLTAAGASRNASAYGADIPAARWESW
jgi:signal transduction histidine kinase